MPSIFNDGTVLKLYAKRLQVWHFFLKVSLLLSQDGHKPCALDLVEHEEEGRETPRETPFLSSQGPKPEMPYHR